MTVQHHVGRLYSLDTLDTRFTASSKQSPSDVQSTTGHGSPHKIDKGVLEASKPRWSTLEFYIYYLVILVAIPLMFKAACDVSNCKPARRVLVGSNC